LFERTKVKINNHKNRTAAPKAYHVCYKKSCKHFMTFRNDPLWHWFPNCASRIRRDRWPVPKGSVDTLL